MAQDTKSENGMGTASLVLGIVMIVLGAFPFIWATGILGIIFGVLGRRRAAEGRATNGTMAAWGLGLSIVGTVVWGLSKFMVGYNSV